MKFNFKTVINPVKDIKNSLKATKKMEYKYNTSNTLPENMKNVLTI